MDVQDTESPNFEVGAFGISIMNSPNFENVKTTLFIFQHWKYNFKGCSFS